MRRSSLVIVLVAACADTSDPGSGEFRVVDQSGGEFLWTEDDHVHRIAGVSPELMPCHEDERGDYTYSWGRFVSVFGICWKLDGSSGSSSGAWWRVLVCEADDDCPQLERYGESYECRAGFCQNIDVDTFSAGVPGHSDMSTLCHGDEPRPEVIDYGADPTALDLAIEAACPYDDGYPDPPCLSIPDECPDPR